jgi:hypothetical protein
MTTYLKIQEDVLTHEGRRVQTCWIAHVKELNGMAPTPSRKRRWLGERAYPCPPAIRPLIEASMRRLGILKP